MSDMKQSGAAPDFNVRKAWSVVRLAEVAQLRSHKNRLDLPLLSVFLHRGVIPYGEGGGQVHKPGRDLSVYQVVRRGDLVLNNQQAWRGSVGVSRYEGIISPAYVVFGLDRRLDPVYADYLFQSRDMVAQYVAASKGVGSIQRDVHMPWLKSVRVPVPDPDEQAAIVRYLAWATGRIDRAIRAKKEVIALLNEQKQAIIHKAVTRGLDPSVPMKDSGVPWLGELPAHWGVLRAKYVFREVDDRSVAGKETHLAMSQRLGLVPSGQVASTLRSESYAGGKLCRVGDLVLNRLKAHLGVFAMARQPGVISPDYTVFRCLRPICVEYFENLLRSPGCRRELRTRAKGIVEGFWRLYTDDFYDIRLPVPPDAEQQRIISSVLDKTSGLTLAAAKAAHQIELLREYRTRLIADVVTGKVDVRTVAASLPAATTDRIAVDATNADAEPEAEEAFA